MARLGLCRAYNLRWFYFILSQESFLPKIDKRSFYKPIIKTVFISKEKADINTCWLLTSVTIDQNLSVSKEHVQFALMTETSKLACDSIERIDTAERLFGSDAQRFCIGVL